jgi:predicted Zn-dependent protease
MNPISLPALDVDADFWSLRFVEETGEFFSVRKGVPQPLSIATDRGVMASVYAAGGYGYAATADVSEEGIRRVLQRAGEWARRTARYALDDSRALPRTPRRAASPTPR